MNRRTATIAALLLAAGTVSTGQVERLDGQRGVRVTVQTARELMTVRALAEAVMSCEAGVGTFDISVKPEQYAALVASGIEHKVVIPDLQAHFDQIRADDARVRAEDDPAWFNTYRSLAEFEARMQHYATNYPALATLSTIGTSIEGRPVKMVRITGPGSTAFRPAFVIQANQHAREWVTPHAAMYMIDRFCETYATDARIRNIVDNIDFHIIVTVNPDGYAHSYSGNPAWRLNRRDNSNNPAGGCAGTLGVDLNRNWGFQWGLNSGSSPVCGSDTYRGVAPFSEPEIAGPRSVVDSLAAQGRLRVHWDIHTSAQLILSAWGFQASPPPAHLPLMNSLGQIIQTGIQSVRGTVYPYGQSSVLLYLVSGGARDYTYGVHEQMSWTLELGGGGFQPPISEILPLCREALAGLLPLAEYYIPPGCYANCDQSTGTPSLSANDFQCFLDAYAAGQSYANCDASTASPTLTANDFQCFLNTFAAGCP